MICGQNYHGGDVQNGCGANFRWTEAPPYVPDSGSRRVSAELNAIPPTQVCMF
jgi:hypothetical protein